MKLELLIIAAFAALVYCTEIEDVEQKKRGVGKGTSLNTIPSGAQKQDYTYSIYQSNPGAQSTSNSYQSVPNSFYPNQASSQYYTSANTQTESPSYIPQPQSPANALPPSTASQFIPLNFIPNSGYQPKYQIVPTKSNGNLQLAIYQQPNNYPSASVPYTPNFFSTHPSNQIGPQTAFNLTPQTGNFNIPPNYQQLSFGGSYFGQPSMFLFAQPNLNAPYNHFQYPNPLQNFYNYYPSNQQNRFNTPYVPQGVTSDYDKVQSTVSQNIPKEDNDIANSNEYATASEPSSSYKSQYSSSRTSYTKL